MLFLAPVPHTIASNHEDIAKNENLKHIPIKHVLVGFNNVLYPFINQIQVPVSDDDLDLTSARNSYESGAIGTDGYFEDPVLGQVEAGHFTVYPNERIFGQRARHFPRNSR